MKVKYEHARLGWEWGARPDGGQVHWAPSASNKSPCGVKWGKQLAFSPRCQVTRVAAHVRGWKWQADGGLFRGLLFHTEIHHMSSEKVPGSYYPEDRPDVGTTRKEAPLCHPRRKLGGTYLALVWQRPLQLSFVISAKENQLLGQPFLTKPH